MTLLFWEKTWIPYRKNTEALLNAYEEVGLEVNLEKTKYMLMSHCKKAGQRHSIRIANRSFEGLAKFKYLGTTLTDQNCMNEEIKSKIKLGECLLQFSPESCLPTCCLGR
jgi:hypothetical protein